MSATALNARVVFGAKPKRAGGWIDQTERDGDPPYSMQQRLVATDWSLVKPFAFIRTRT